MRLICLKDRHSNNNQKQQLRYLPLEAMPVQKNVRERKGLRDAYKDKEKVSSLGLKYLNNELWHKNAQKRLMCFIVRTPKYFMLIIFTP